VQTLCLLLTSARCICSEKQSKIYVVFPETAADSNKSGRVLCDLDAKKREHDFFEHPETDVVAVRFSIPAEVKYELIPFELLATPEIFSSVQIHPTDHVVYPSLLANVADSNFSVVRTGSIARTPNQQKIELNLGDRDHPIISKQEIFLIDTMAIPGASGSPLFLSPEPRQTGAAVTAFLLGIIQAHANSPEIIHPVQPAGPDSSPPPDPAKQYWFGANAGIAVVIPAWHIREIMETADFKHRISELIKEDD